MFHTVPMFHHPNSPVKFDGATHAYKINHVHAKQILFSLGLDFLSVKVMRVHYIRHDQVYCGEYILLKLLSVSPCVIFSLINKVFFFFPNSLFVFVGVFLTRL